MATLGMNDVKTGQKILVNNDPCVITETEYVKPGKGQAFTRVKYRSIKSGRVVEMTMKATDSVEQADVVDTDMQYLYSDGEYWHFMNPETFEQVQAEHRQQFPGVAHGIAPELAPAGHEGIRARAGGLGGGGGCGYHCGLDRALCPCRPHCSR